jgi:hypothetical protein
MAAELDYGYSDQPMDYGYGDAAPDMDYGYGDANPDDADYGYGDACTKPEDAEYGYGDAKAEEAPTRRPKRRGSVTKFSLEPETSLTAASVINDLRNGIAPVVTPSPAPVREDQKDASSLEFVETSEAAEIDGGESGPPVRKKSGMLRFLQRR